MTLLHRCAELDLAGQSPALISEALDVSPQMVAWLMQNDGYQLVKEKVNASRQDEGRTKVKCNTGER